MSFREAGAGVDAGSGVGTDGGGTSTLHGASRFVSSLVWRLRTAKPLSIWLRASARVLY